MKQVVILLMIMLLLIGCAPTAPGAGATEPEQEFMAPLTKQEEEMEDDTVETAEPQETADPASSAAEVEEEETSDTQTADPVTVDLRQLTPEPIVVGTPVVQPAPGQPGDPAARLLQAVTVDLSQRLDVDVEAIELVEIAEATWSDSSLGCPQRDMAYLQVLTDGYQVTLQAQGQTFVYHARDAAYFLLCNSGQPSQPITLPPAPEQ